MIKQQTLPSSERIMNAMIELIGLFRSHRVLVVGSNAFDIYVSLHHRGFSRAATTTTCRIPCGQHDVALVAGAPSSQALEALLVRAVPFLNARASMGIWIEADRHQRGRKLSTVLGELGFRIEAGAKCESGFVFSARRQEWGHTANAA